VRQREHEKHIWKGETNSAGPEKNKTERLLKKNS
jgi:hypothetical protein